MQKIIRLVIILVILSVNNIYSTDRININQSNFSKVRLALNLNLNNTFVFTDIMHNLYRTISNDLLSNNLFEVLKPELFIEYKYGVDHIPNFSSWKAINTNLVLNLSIKKQSQDSFYISFILWDVILKKSVIKKLNLEVKKIDLRKLGHFISDLIYEYSTGYEGYFNSKILYIAESGKYKNRIKRIAIMDYDGSNHKYLTDGKNIVSSPKFFPDEKKILYVMYQNNMPNLVIMDLETKKLHIISKIGNISFAPEISPNGEEIIFSIAQNGESHIYEYKISDKSLKQLTFGNHINTSPCYSPCKKYIIFNSNKYSTRDLFVLRRSDNKIFKLTQSSSSYAEPKWSVKNWIAFTKIHRTLGFTIGVFNIEDKNLQYSERIIATAYLVENPVWNKNGRMLLFTKGSRLHPQMKDKQFMEYDIKNLHKLYIIDAFGIYGEHIINTPGDASDADWSKSSHKFQ